MAYKEAAEELAMQARGSQFRDEVTVEDARSSVDTDVIVEWVAIEALGRDDNILIADTIAQRLTKELGRTLLCAVAIDHPAKVLEIIKGAVVEQVARDLAYAANLINEQYDPTDEEMSRSSYAAWVADPVADDRRALAKLAR